MIEDNIFKINQDTLVRALNLLREKYGLRKACRELEISTTSFYNYYDGVTYPNKIKTIKLLSEKTGIPIANFFDLNTKIEILSSTAHDPICQEIYKLCNQLPDKYKNEHQSKKTYLCQYFSIKSVISFSYLFNPGCSA